MYTQTYTHNGSSLDITRSGNDIEITTRPDDDLGVVVTIPAQMLDRLVTRAIQERA